MDVSEMARILGAMGGKVGGRSTSPAKKRASRKNGKLGGWHAQKRNRKPSPA